MKKIILLMITMSFIFTGCGLFHKQTEKTASELLAEARAEYEDKDYMDAIELFQQLKNWYPFSEHVIEAELKIADSYYQMEKYNEAIRAYQYFEKLHPVHPMAELAAFKIGESYYMQVLSIDRDQTNTKNALKSFERFLHSYPGSQNQSQALEYIDNCINKLADSEFYVAHFYFKQKAYDASIERIKNILALYPTTKAAAKAQKLMDKIPEKDLETEK